jgi:hypothetical protein
MYINSSRIYLPARNRKTCLNTVLFLVASSIYMPAQAAVATANVSANIISTLSITTQTGSGGSQGMVFGDISSSSVAGTIVLTPSGSRTTTGGPTINTSTTASPAAFDVQGDVNATYAITLPVSVVLNGSSSGSMVVDSFTSSPTSTGVLDGTGRQILYVGGSLKVGSNQVFGSYSGQMTVTVAYN